MTYNRVIVMNPPSPIGYVSNKDSMGGFGQLFPIGAVYMPPLDLVYLVSYLQEKGMPLEVLECLGLELNKDQAVARVGRRLEDCDATADRVLILVRTSTPTLDWDLSICAAIKAAMPLVDIGIFGAVALHTAQRIQQEPAVNYIIKDEPDETVYELVTGEQPQQIRGLSFRQGKAWIDNVSRPFRKELDELPFPKWDLFPHDKYKLPKSSARSDVKFLPMLTSRGCPVGCHYCPYPVGQGTLFRLRSPQNVVDEIEQLIGELGVQYILFRDPIFSLNQRRVLEICEEIKRRGLKFEWKCETRVDCLRDETLQAMAEAGCTGINFGVESAEVEIQAGVGRKPITRERFIQTITLCRNLGIKTFGFFIIGLPGDTLATILSSIQFAIDVRTNMVQFTAASPLIGTELRNRALADAEIEGGLNAYVNSYSAMMGTGYLTKEQVAELHRFALFIGTYLLNRKGILKDDNRTSRPYQIVKRTADALTIGAAQVVFKLGKWYFERRYGPVTVQRDPQMVP